MIRDMTKLRIIGPKTRMPDIISDLHKLKVMHIIEGQSDEANQGKPMMEAEQLSVSLIKLRAVISQLKIKPSEEHKPEKLAKIIKTVDFIAKTLKAANESLKSADEIEKKGNTIIAHLNVLKALDIKEKTEFETIDVFVGYIKDAVKFKESLLKKTDRFLLKTVNGAISLFIDKRFSDDAGHILSSNQFSQIPLTFEDRNEVLQAISKAKTDRKEALIKIDLIRKTYADILPSYERMLSQELTKAEAPLKFIETDEAFLIWGFAPKARAQSMIQSLMHRAHNNLFIEEREIEKYDQIPVSLDNPRKVKDFESLLSLYSLPKYKEIDPSWFLFLTFPLLFGFMLGDMGYGITTAILFYILKKKMPNAGGFFNVLILSSFASIFFGIVFGEFFGLELYHPLLNRNPEHGLEPLMITAIAVGVLHINAGLIAGFINEFRAHGLKAAIFEKFSWIVLEISVAVLALSYTQILSKV
ncbi:MAG TPA: V-type ATPase 116kDa subunit family protein, partial [Candidatus Nanoarchaeia archaeon]|nr:V-type ATPase 116kDa subunit family protein [Candidatus Nanoarchaeia archaeon]